MLHPELRKMANQSDNRNTEKIQKTRMEKRKDSTTFIRIWRWKLLKATKRREPHKLANKRTNKETKMRKDGKHSQKEKERRSTERTQTCSKRLKLKPASEKVPTIKNVKENTGHSEIEKIGAFGITFTAQNKGKEETPSSKKGKHKVTTTQKIIQETHAQTSMRAKRVQKKTMENMNPPYERRTRSIRGNG